MAIRREAARPSSAAQWAFIRKIANAPKRTITGSAATMVDNHQWPRGSYTCVQVIITPHTELADAQSNRKPVRPRIEYIFEVRMSRQAGDGPERTATRKKS